MPVILDTSGSRHPILHSKTVLQNETKPTRDGKEQNLCVGSRRGTYMKYCMKKGTYEVLYEEREPYTFGLKNK